MSPLRRIAFALSFLAALTLLGSAGYVWLAGYSWVDALYMTVTTITTVGYGEPQPLDDVGRLYSVALIVLGVGTTLYLLAAIAETLLEGRVRELLQRTAMRRRIEALEGHVIVCGYGRFGRVVAEELQRAGEDLVVLEIDPRTAAELDAAGLPYLIVPEVGDHELVLAGVRRARAIVVATASDADNVFITLSARELNPAIAVHARGETDTAVRRLRRAGAAHVVSPFRMGGLRTAASILRPAVVEFLEIAGPLRGEAVDLEEIRVLPGCALCGKSIRTLEDEGGRFRVVALRRDGEAVELVPEPGLPIQPGDQLVVIGPRADLERLAEAAQPGSA